MSVIDNYEQIKSLLKFDDPDKFYFIQLLRRPKDGHNIGSHGVNVGNFYVGSAEYFNKKEELIKDMCNYYNARAYIRLNRRSFKRTALKSAQLILEFIDNNTPELTRKVFLKVCGRNNSEKVKTWLIDIDTEEQIESMPEIIKTIDCLRPYSGTSKVIDIIPTRSGKHIITTAFDLGSFNKIYKIDVHKDNPTILYIPGTNE